MADLVGLLAVILILAVLLWRPARAAPARKREPSAGTIKGRGDFECQVVGESHYQRALEQIAGKRTDESAELACTAHLIPEPENKHDRNAIRVDIAGLTVGYLSRDDAEELGERLRAQGLHGKVVAANALIVGGWDRGGRDVGHFGVRLDIPID